MCFLDLQSKNCLGPFQIIENQKSNQKSVRKFLNYAFFWSDKVTSNWSWLEQEIILNNSNNSLPLELLEGLEIIRYISILWNISWRTTLRIPKLSFETYGKEGRRKVTKYGRVFGKFEKIDTKPLTFVSSVQNGRQHGLEFCKSIITILVFRLSTFIL